jgi:hypothetical protein
VIARDRVIGKSETRLPELPKSPEFKSQTFFAADYAERRRSKNKPTTETQRESGDPVIARDRVIQEKQKPFSPQITQKGADQKTNLPRRHGGNRVIR